MTAHAAIHNLTTATVSVYPHSEHGPSVAIWTIHDSPKQPKAEDGNLLGNSLPLPSHTPTLAPPHTYPCVPPLTTTNVPILHAYVRTLLTTLGKHNIPFR